ncbi:hypothetical protein I7I53_00320 [Histoplasma capsulatum var. duboisii H88]|uniref:Uncharacterized protein n=1 Tax=Ajellomyces capsulatus (strain H88) TaxID=544711 RepID=A0A8A1LI24_AJEC8|nr:hypothetical protein I7I53_00320 [Histoplasma capsulatum var. duboisii H88]
MYFTTHHIFQDNKARQSRREKSGAAIGDLGELIIHYYIVLCSRCEKSEGLGSCPAAWDMRAHVLYSSCTGKCTEWSNTRGRFVGVSICK